MLDLWRLFHFETAGSIGSAAAAIIDRALYGVATGSQTGGIVLYVRASAGDLIQTGEVLSGGSYLSQHDLRIHFGLGNHTSLDQAEILWPNGKTETLANLAADRYYVVREGEGVVSSKMPEPRGRSH